MVGYSKWSKVKHIKGSPDVKRGVASSRLLKEISVDSRLGGGDHALSDSRLYPLVDTARPANLPKENVKHAIKKGTGKPEGACYESHAPDSVALALEATTDNKSPEAKDLRKANLTYRDPEAHYLPDNPVVLTGKATATQAHKPAATTTTL